MLKAVMLRVFELAGSETDHIPPVMVGYYLHIIVLLFRTPEYRRYEYSYNSPCYRIRPIALPVEKKINKNQYDFEISNAKRADDRDEVYSRVSNLPALINLGS